MTDRRTLLKGLALIAATVGGVERLLTPAQAQAAALPLKRLTPAQARTLAAFGEALVSGAAALGLAHYVDDQLAKRQAENLLMIRYLDVPPPWDGFYSGALAAVDGLARIRHDVDFAALDAGQAAALVGEIAAGPDPAGWAGPPAGLAYFVIRADAIDVVYGTEAGFARLGVPYMAHIPPESHW
ncbi:hypothetical protein GCM10007973_05550 [Polymorphobacter multimanifer]|uniref:Gluconate 2-dehydrogenase subunit 3 family protein n=1 Tax=Polymorphobacter multimanifer TaxID=1070431 RepID=A0A841L2E7_9SPHN|nr:gluconate 2-dehydrogenase subunit 3 family protein [Polymorphobacter multimanifer]MBB6226764.1 hypothetical protein [Polymorphobacter multimanifer]GGI71475.1 hypothetical protein GCM10007973_05550 [Polymorphobacter multimanifer]